MLNDYCHEHITPSLPIMPTPSTHSKKIGFLGSYFIFPTNPPPPPNYLVDLIFCYLPLILYLLLFFVYIAQDRFLAYSPEQHPIVLQIGGNNLENLAKATELANPYHYDEINFKFVQYFVPYF